MAQIKKAGLSLAIMALLVLGIFSTIPQNSKDYQWLDEIRDDSYFSIKGVKTVNTYDVPNWRVGDKWTYDTDFSVEDVIINAGLTSSSVSTLDGETEVEVTDIRIENIEGFDTLVYIVEIDGEFSTPNNGANLEGLGGRLEIDYSGEDMIRASDLATISASINLNIDFYWLNFIRQDVADLNIDTEYDPFSEIYDFPLSLGDSWASQYNQSITGSGTSDYLEDIDELLSENSTNNNTYSAISEGTPTEDGVSVGYSGCPNSIKVESYNESGDANGYKWYCDTIRSYAWNHVEFSVGMVIDWKISDYEPAASSNVIATSDPGVRNQEIDIGLQSQLLPLNATSGIWANYSSPTGLFPASSVDFRFEPENWEDTINYATNSAYSPLDSGWETDDTPTSIDWASHGLIAWEPSAKLIGARTIILDENVEGMDIAASPNVLIERTRDGEVTTLTEITGYSAVPGDLLNFNIGAINTGFQSSPSTTLTLSLPDGTDLSAPIPSLLPLQQARVDIQWNVAQEYQIGALNIYYEINPIPNEANTENNDGSFSLFIGRLPVASWQNSAPDYTLTNITFDALLSDDPDGGDITCHFVFGDINGESGIDENKWMMGEYEEILSETCIVQKSWDDNGVYAVGMLITDDEGDTDFIEGNVEIMNRAPWLNLTSVLSSIPVETSITIDASDSGDLDSKNPTSPVTINWNGTTCQEGGLDFKCTISPFTEGPYTITAFVTDDDGEITYSEFTFNSENVAPSNIMIEATIDGEEISQQNGIRNVPEGMTVDLIGTAEDTANDRDSLTFHWKSTNDSAGNNIEWESDKTDSDYTGSQSIISTDWSISGPHFIHLSVSDDDNESISSSMSFNVINVPPIAENIPEQVPIGEEDTIVINGTSYDTVNDMNTLITCWDRNPMNNSDNAGNSDDDCDIEGDTLTYSWTEQGQYTIIYHVTDDNGASDSVETTITVVNRPPKSAIFITEEVKIQDSAISFDASGTTDSAGDIDSLVYRWDFDTSVDSDGDGITSNDNDATGKLVEWTYTIPGQYTIRLEVEDKDGQTGSATQTLNVTALETGIFSSLTEDSGIQVVIVILALIFVALIAVLLVTRFRKEEEDPFANMRFEDQPMSPPPIEQMAPLETPTPAQENYAAQADSMYEMANLGTSVSQQPVPMQQPEPVQQGPPLPPTGLPEGWTMEQWAHYGEQYLAKSENSNTENANYSQNTSTSSSDLDLDF